MYIIYNLIEDTPIFKGDDRGFISIMKLIAVENGDTEYSILGFSDAEEYLEIYCDNLVAVSEEKLELTGWVCADPDENQWGRKLSEDKYEFKQDLKWTDGTVTHPPFEINLKEYSKEKLEEYVTPYGYSVDQLEKDYPVEDAKYLMAECIFEMDLI